MDLREMHAQREVELQVAMVEYIVVLVAEVRYQLFNLSWRHPNALEVVLIL